MGAPVRRHATNRDIFLDYSRAVGYNDCMEREVIVKRSARLLRINIAKTAVGGVLTVPLIVIAVYLFCGVDVGWYGWLAAVSIPAMVAFINGVKGLHHHRKMPETPISFGDGEFTVLGEALPPKAVKEIFIAAESRSVGQITIATENKKYAVYGVTDYRRVASRLIDILADNDVEPFKSARDNFLAQQAQAEAAVKVQAENQFEQTDRKTKR